MKNAAEKYAAELKQSEHDHHTPTAGAMIGHIIANLKIHQAKLQQGRFYAQGEASPFVQAAFGEMAEQESELVDELALLMLDEGEVIPTTTAEFQQYTMLEESGQLKYEAADVLLMTAAKDFTTQNLFITRGIKLAEKETKYPLQTFLIKLLSFNQRQIRTIQTYLGHELTEGLTEEDEDE
ncbi:ferritin-like domain-containing protein [Enterococcus sp. CSURQ0835]|uniref:ferritin-like domain-containing protein n=1 Tax=Enterococcus sp. CSURQ0835 TaxID=2681394 RepID=UPI001356AADF|nr:ferritin-like domain-containing protein [Enterococcus sp. CSURQ0835]